MKTSFLLLWCITDILLKHVAHFFVVCVWLTMLFPPTLGYLACFYVMSDSFCHVAQWTFSSKLQFIWKHNEICPTQLQLSAYTSMNVGRGFLLFLFDPVVLTLLDKVAMGKSLCLNSGKKMILVFGFFSCESEGQQSFLLHLQVLSLSSGAPLAMLLHHQRPTRDVWESLRDSFGLLSPSARGAWLAWVWGVSVEKLPFALQGKPFQKVI